MDNKSSSAIRFIYNLITKIPYTEIKNINELIGIEFKHDLKHIVKYFDKELKEMLIEVTRNIVKSELEYNIANIKPNYDTGSMSGAWYIPDLLSSIYFSIFFLNPNFEIIKKCSNPICPSYFSVLHSNKRRKYCSSRCANTVNQRNSRLRKKTSQKDCTSV